MDVVPVVIAGVAAALALALRALLRLFIGNWAAVGLAAAWCARPLLSLRARERWWFGELRNVPSSSAARNRPGTTPNRSSSLGRLGIACARAGVARIRALRRAFPRRADRHVQPGRRPARGARRRIRASANLQRAKGARGAGPSRCREYRVTGRRRGRPEHLLHPTRLAMHGPTCWSSHYDLTNCACSRLTRARSASR